jgi:hypothetical protein
VTFAKGAKKALKAAAPKVYQIVREGLASLNKAVEDDHANDEATVDAIIDALTLDDLDKLVFYAIDPLTGMWNDAGLTALAQLGVDDRSDLVDQVNERAVEFARDRGAELVGKTFNVAGDLVDRADAEWTITEGTRDMVREILSAGLADNIGGDSIVENLQASNIFSTARADLIARTEIARANSFGALNGYKAAQSVGVVVRKSWMTAEDDLVDEIICAPNSDQGPIDLDDQFLSGDDAPPGHPNCRCALAASVAIPKEEPDE